jgi:D-3-phosphoglycerate dehydrogenase
MKVSILDDYHGTLRTLPCFSKLAGHDVTYRRNRPDTSGRNYSALGTRGLELRQVRSAVFAVSYRSLATLSASINS